MDNPYTLQENVNAKNKFSIANLFQLIVSAVLIISAVLILILFEDIIEVSIYIVYVFVGLILGIAAVQIIFLFFKPFYK